MEVRAYGGLDFSGHLEDQGEDEMVFLTAKAFEACKPREPFLLPGFYLDMARSR